MRIRVYYNNGPNHVDHEWGGDASKEMAAILLGTTAHIKSVEFYFQPEGKEVCMDDPSADDLLKMWFPKPISCVRGVKAPLSLDEIEWVGQWDVAASQTAQRTADYMIISLDQIPSGKSPIGQALELFK